MIYDFGPILQYIQVTAQYSNAVLVAILPHLSDVAKKVELPMPLPITASAVKTFDVNIVKGNPGGTVVLTNGCVFWFNHGLVDSFETPHSYSVLQNPGDIPRFYGPLHMNKAEAVQLARNTIKNLGYSLESVFAELEPKVEMPPTFGTNVVPHYRIKWLDPRGGGSTVDIEVNANRKRIERINFWSFNLQRPPPKVDVEPEPMSLDNPMARVAQRHINPAYAYALLPIVLKSVTDYGKKLALPLPEPLTTNHVKRFSYDDNGGWPHSELELTNGYQFIYRNDQVNGFYAPDNFFHSDKRKVLVADFAGKWNMSEQEAIELARNTVAKLNYPTNLIHTDIKPTEVIKPTMIGKELIPRYQITWMYPDTENMYSWTVVEIDADKKSIKSVYLDDKSFWNHPPPIDVPISLSTKTNAAPKKKSVNRQSTAAPLRPLKLFPK